MRLPGSRGEPLGPGGSRRRAHLFGGDAGPLFRSAPHELRGDVLRAADVLLVPLVGIDRIEARDRRGP